MIRQIEAVGKFHDAFGVKNRDEPTVEGREYALRVRLLREEVDEYEEAAERGDVVGVADALGDIAYILFGSILTHGLQSKMEAVFDEIQRSNMSKLGADGRPIYREDGKVLKGPGYSPPDIASILAK